MIRFIVDNINDRHVAHMHIIDLPLGLKLVKEIFEMLDGLDSCYLRDAEGSVYILANDKMINQIKRFLDTPSTSQNTQHSQALKNLEAFLSTFNSGSIIPKSDVQSLKELFSDWANLPSIHTRNDLNAISMMNRYFGDFDLPYRIEMRRDQWIILEIVRGGNSYTQCKKGV